MAEIPAHNKPITLDDKIAVVKRELGMRKKHYPNWVTGINAKMTPAEAAYQIAGMEEVLKDYETLKLKNEGVQTSLF